MATFHQYICTNSKCDFEIETEPFGHYALMSGEYYEFRCPRCKEIHAFSADELAAKGYGIQCPVCGGDLFSWNATDCKCPKCHSALEDTGITMLAD